MRTRRRWFMAASAAACLACGDRPEVLWPDARCAGAAAATADVAGEWWAEGAVPPTLHVEQAATELRADLAFSGVMRRGGVGAARGGCVSLAFPGQPGTTEPPLLLRGELLAPSRLRITFGDSGSADAPRTVTLVRQPPTP